MNWEFIKTRTPDGERVTGFICGGRSSGRKFNCQTCLKRRSERQCDYPVGDGKTCDKHLCAKCAVSVGTDRDYCPGHPPAEEIPAR